MKKNIFKKGVICTLLGLFMLNTNIIKAKAESLENSNNEKGSILEVEVLYNEFDEEYIKNMTLDDGTKINEYDYSISYAKPLFPSTPTLFSYYPIGDYFSFAGWITRDGTISLSTDPKLAVRIDRYKKDQAWLALSSPTAGFGSHSNWKNSTVMKWQFDCHFDKFPGTFKPEWNLEPSRTASSYQQVLNAFCNP